MTAQSQIISKYGLPTDSYKNKYCEMWEIENDFPWVNNILVNGKPWKRVYINKEFKVKLFNAFTNLERSGLHIEIKTFDGCYVLRNTRGRKLPSLHSWAMAIDFNAETEKLSQEFTNWSGRFIAIMKAAGLFWGGDWKRKDPMHFSHYNG
jgi:hypothetical protein